MKMSAFGNTTVACIGGYRRFVLAICFACCLALWAAHPLWAAEFDVDSELDGVDSNLGDGICANVTVAVGAVCTLRAAIQEANFNPLDADTINLPAGTYVLTIENEFDNAEDAAATGDLDITTNVSIEGAGADVTIIEASTELHDRVIHLVGEDAILGLSRVTVRNGNTTELVGTRDGGGILVGGGKLDGFELVVADNTSPTFGGGIMFIGVNSSTLHRCTINGNAATGTNARGGGIFHGQNYVLSLANCTISDNEAVSRGGGIDVSNNSNDFFMLNTTVAANRLTGDPEEGAGIYIGNSTEVHIFSSLIADNFAQGDVPNDCYGQIDVLDFSLIEVPAAGNSCIIAGDGENNSSFFGSDDPLLGPLADNGGTLQTHALLAGSIAIDAGSQLAPGSGGRACYATDARGQVRPARAYCDMGAFELEAFLYMPKLEK
jgi:hypothetical protein